MNATIRTIYTRRRGHLMVAAMLIDTATNRVIQSVLRWSDSGAVTALSEYAIRHRINIQSVN